MRLLTNDLYEGAWLLSKGMELVDLWMDDKTKRAVVFEFHGENVLGLQNEYKRGEAQANVVKLKGAIREIKDRMFWLLKNKEINKERLRKGGNYVGVTQKV